ncbi:MAG: FTR1 family protein [Zoogloeaceae bacterium]|jgi:high-affinity iron transporter|nr:FTR1 family protein [Zoogloeaceae bacterium]
MLMNALVIVWRECLEAMLVIGILSAWVVRSRPEARRALWLGVAGGIGLALALAALMQGALSEMDDRVQEGVQIGLILLAAALMTHMVLWMQRHARGLRAEMEASLDRAVVRRGLWGIAAVAAIAVAREGAETVIFLQGVGSSGNAWDLALAAIAGFLLAALTAWAAARGLRFLPMRTVFGVSSILLLAFAAGFIVLGVDRMIGMEWLPPGIDPLWDTSAWLDDGAGLGKWLADLFGYRARPAATAVAAYAAYWLMLLALRFRRRLSGNMRIASA